MELSGEHRIEAPREAVWRALNDPDVLGRAIPGCQAIERDSDSGFTAKVKARIGPVSAVFSGKVTLSDIDPPSGYVIAGEGTGGAAGFASGSAKVTLEADGNATVLRYEAEGKVGGKLAQVGARLVEGSARKLAGEFFGTFGGLLAADEPEGEAIMEPSEEPVAGISTGVAERLLFGFAGLIVAALAVVAAFLQ